MLTRGRALAVPAVATALLFGFSASAAAAADPAFPSTGDASAAQYGAGGSLGAGGTVTVKVGKAKVTANGAVALGVSTTPVPCIAEGFGGKIFVNLPVPPTQGVKSIVLLRVTALDTLLGPTQLAPTQDVTTFFNNADTKPFLARINKLLKLRTHIPPDPWQPFILTSKAKQLTVTGTTPGSQAEFDLAKTLQAMGAQLATDNQDTDALVWTGSPLRLDVIERTLNGGTTTLKHGFLFPCATPPPSGVNVPLTGFQLPAGGSGSGLSGSTIPVLLLLAALAGAGLVGVPRSIRRRRASR